MWILGVVATTTVLASGLESPSELGGLEPPSSYLHAQQVSEARIWMDRGTDPVVQAGDRVRIYYRTETDAYVAIFRIDTDGTTRMLFPRSPTENHYARGGRDYRLLFPRSAYWNVDDRPGIGYFFVVTSPTPFDLSDFRYSFFDGTWDLSGVGSTVYSDPYVAMDEYVARLVPDWEFVDYGLDYVSYNVGAAHEYPRFLCYQCHGFRPYNVWNPYRYACVNFRVVVYDDPYFYPYRRYRADRVVVVGPRNPIPPRFEFKERASGEPGTPVRIVRGSPSDDGRRATPRPGTSPSPGRVAAPPVTSRTPARPSTRPPERPPERGPEQTPDRPTTRAPNNRGPATTPSRADGPRTTPDGGRVAAPPTRPSLERRTTPSTGPSRQQTPTRRAGPRATPTQRATPTPRPRPSATPSAPPRRTPERPSTSRPPSRSNGTSTARPAPRERSRTAPARATTRPPARRPSD